MKRLLYFAGILLFAFSVSHAQLGNKRTLTLDAAKQIVHAAEQEAKKNGLSMVLALLDDGGNLLYFERMDNVQLGSIDVALEKAKTALYFKRPTKSYQDRVAGGELFLLKIPSVMPVEGGVPFLVDGQVVGSIGVSGGTPQQDGMVAQAALTAFQALTNSK